MDDGILAKIAGGMATVFGGVFMFGLNRHARTLDGIKTDIAVTKAELAKHQLEVAVNYARVPSIDRLHERLDNIEDKMDKKMDAVGADIKTILGMVK